MSKVFLPDDPNQRQRPAPLQELPPEIHLAYCISAMVGRLDLSQITAR